MRLDRFLAETGFGTRSEVKKLIKSGRVAVENSAKPTPELHIDCDKDTVTVDGVKVCYKKFIYLMMNKPQDCVSATYDRRLETVIDYLPEEYRHFDPFPVGRLDIDTEGLLILTNDGELSHRLLAPRKHIPKEYFMITDKPFTDSDIAAFRDGVTLDDGYKTLPAELDILSVTAPFSAKIIIHEGKFHQIKRMAEAVGKTVVFLKRTKMNNLSLDENLKLGEIRELTKQELILLDTKPEEENL